MSLRDLFARDAPEDAVLALIGMPRIVDRALKVAVISTVAIWVVSIMASSSSMKPVGIAVLLLSFLPWLLWMTEVLASRRLLTGLVLLAPASMAAAAFVGIRISDGLGQYFFYLAMATLVLAALAPRREAAQTVTATFVIFLGLGLFTGNVSSCIFWAAVIALIATILVGVRAGALEIARAQQRLVQAQAAGARRQIARDVHDVVAHTIAVTMLHLTAARMAVNRGAATDAIDALDEAERQGLTSLTDVQRVLRLLQPNEDATPPPGLGAIPTLVAKYRDAGLPVTLTFGGSVDGVTPTVGCVVYRVVQEALANASRHGDGSATVDLRVVDGAVDLTVANPAHGGEERPPGNGIRGMRERVEAVGGTISVGLDGGEWRVRVELTQDLVVTSAGTEASTDDSGVVGGRPAAGARRATAHP